MNWILALLAAVAAVIAAGLYWARMNASRQLGLMQATETSKVADLSGKAPGTLVELKGRITSAAPLVAEMSGVPAVYVRTQVERHYREVTRDSKGQTRTETRYQTESNDIRHAPAAIEDGSGSVPVDFDGADVEAVQVHQHYEPVATSVGSVIGSLVGAGGTLGHRYTEWAIAPDAQVYVLATRNASGGIGAAAGRKMPYVISTRSEEERSKSLATRRIWLLVGAIAVLLLAAGLLYAAIQAGPM